MTRRRARGAAPSALPCVTIARSPANDVRVIVDAFVSTPVLVQLLTDRGGLILEHRAELRALLQQLSGKLAAAIERPADVVQEVAQLATRAEALMMSPSEGAAALAPEDAGPTPRPAERRRPARHAAPSRFLAIATAPEASGADWPGGRLLR
ncbi:MAG: hypothetical protein IT359_08835 [Gemmatimonadaceae bacterium]|nr:hypothetical protein [Gemmatimonadaceae bacterium]